MWNRNQKFNIIENQNLDLDNTGLDMSNGQLFDLGKTN
jgi:hypothetical protein